ncbi:MAG TPA: TrbI/VirB10 family protein [Terriglobales bacterium]|nr:TrbI/VirB10 family protein [Terriglobales bacterium]
MNNNGSKPTYVEPEGQNAATALDEVPDETLTAQAFENIHNTERLSGFGRFAAKMQDFFQASKPSQSKQQSSHLKAAPIMMSAGLLLLLATGLLFLLSKPESSVHSHFRQPTGLSGADDHKPLNSPSTDSAVTENQLVGSENRDMQAASRVKSAARAGDDAATRRFTFADGSGSDNNPSISPNPTGVSELQNPATVFVANPTPSPVLNLGSTFRETRSSDLQLPSGTEIIAHTTNAISSGLESPVIAVVDRTVQLGNSVVIPQGARVIGYTAGAVKDRINVRFTSLILPSNREVTISGLALMKDGSAGLVGRVQGSGHPILSTATRIGTGAAVVATEFAGAGSLNQPFSQADYLRNQMGYEIASEGNRYSNRLQQPTNVPIVNVNTNQSIRIFLLNALGVSDSRIPSSKSAQQIDTAPTLTADQNQSPEQALAVAQTAYIQALEAQLADTRAALDARKSNGHN